VQAGQQQLMPKLGKRYGASGINHDAAALARMDCLKKPLVRPISDVSDCSDGTAVCRGHSVSRN
jgi:hypothetical protein